MIYITTETLIDSITKRIGMLCAEAKLDAMNGRTTLAKDMERILLPLLRRLFDSPDLKACTKITESGFDLTNDDKSLVVQVSTRQDSSKFWSTLRTCHKKVPGAKVIFIILDLNIGECNIWEKIDDAKGKCICRRRKSGEPYSCFSDNPQKICEDDQDKKNSGHTEYSCKELTLLEGELYSAAELQGLLIERYQGGDTARQKELRQLEQDMSQYEEPIKFSKKRRKEACLVAHIPYDVDECNKSADYLSIMNVDGTAAVNVSVEVQSGLPFLEKNRYIPPLFLLEAGSSSRVATLRNPGEEKTGYRIGVVMLSWMDAVSGRRYVRSAVLYPLVEYREPTEDNPSVGEVTDSLYDWSVENDIVTCN